MATLTYRREKIMLRLAVRCSRSIEEIEAKSDVLKRWMERRIRLGRWHRDEGVDDWMIAGDVFVFRDAWVGFSRVWLYVGAHAFRNPGQHREVLAATDLPVVEIVELEGITA